MGLIGLPGRTLLRPASVTLMAVVAAAFAATFAAYPSAEGLLLAIAFALLAACAATDLNDFRVPNLFTYSGTVMMLAGAAISGDFLGAASGGLIGGGILLLLAILSRGKVGGGDAKLAAFGGAIVGGRYVIYALFLGSVAAAVVSLVLLILGRITRKDPLPFAPFLSLGFAAMSIMTGSTLEL